MDTLQGTVTHCQHTVQISGRQGSGMGITTTHLATFRPGPHVVRFSGNEPVAVADGDLVFVAGAFSRGMLHADAIHNRTTGIESHTGIVSRWVLMGGVLAIGFVLLLTPFGGVLLYKGIICLLVTLVAMFLCLRASQTRRALEWVRSTPARH